MQRFELWSQFAIKSGIVLVAVCGIEFGRLQVDLYPCSAKRGSALQRNRCVGAQGVGADCDSHRFCFRLKLPVMYHYALCRQSLQGMRYTRRQIIHEMTLLTTVLAQAEIPLTIGRELPDR